MELSIQERLKDLRVERGLTLEQLEELSLIHICIEQAGCRTRKDSTRFVDTLITASPEFFKKKSPKEIQEFFQRVPHIVQDGFCRDSPLLIFEKLSQRGR